MPFLTAQASAAEVLRHRDVARPDRTGANSSSRCSSTASTWCPRYVAALRRRPHHRGSVDLRRTLRAQLRSAGELAPATPPAARGSGAVGSCC